MRRNLGPIILSLAICLAASTAFALDGRTLSNAAVAPAGLRVNWMSQIATGSRGSIVDLYLNVNENNSTTFYALDFGLGREVITQNDLDAFGNPRGIEGAQEFAELRKEIVRAELDARGFEKTEIKMAKYTLPETILYSLTTDGLITATNADTGKTKWQVNVSNHNQPAIGIGANNNYVAAVCGSSVYCINAENGKMLFERPCASSPSSSPAISDELIYVPLINGRVEVFNIGARGVASVRFVGSGRALSRPTLTEKSISWATTSGHLNVAMHKIRANKDSFKKESSDEPKTPSELARERAKEMLDQRIAALDSIGGITYRLRTADEFHCAATYLDGMFFASSLQGFVYGINEAAGSIEWEFSTGEEIDQSPIPIGNALFVVTSNHSLYKMNAQTGALVWEVPVSGVSEYVGASKDKLYVKDPAGNLIVLDQETGNRVGSVFARGMDLVLANSQSDRLYIGTQRGLIQCLSEVSSAIPHFHSSEFIAAADKPASEMEKGMEAAVEEDDDPFAKFKVKEAEDDNPFGGGGDAGDDNPFGGGGDKSDDNPFGGGGDKSDDNPFGGGGDTSGSDDNPFGGGGDSKSDDNPFGGGG